MSLVAAQLEVHSIKHRPTDRASKGRNRVWLSASVHVGAILCLPEVVPMPEKALVSHKNGVLAHDNMSCLKFAAIERGNLRGKA